MKPKEKAVELRDRFIRDGLIDRYMGELSAKQCALICVDEVLNVTGQIEPWLAYDYRNEVKTEIQNL